MLELKNVEWLRDQVGSKERIEVSWLLHLRSDLLGLPSEVHLPKALRQRVQWALRHALRRNALLYAWLEALLLHRHAHAGDGRLRRRRPRADGICAEVVRLRGVCAFLLLFGHGAVEVGGRR